MNDIPFILTVGEPAGIGPDLIIELSFHPIDIPWIVLSPPELLQQRAHLLGKTIYLQDVTDVKLQWSHRLPGTVYFIPLHTPQPVVPKQLNMANVPFVLESLRRAYQWCCSGSAQGMVTGPVHKAIMQHSGISFTGQTEFLANLAHVDKTVMMLMSAQLKIALLTTHLPLRKVADAITSTGLAATIQILHAALQRQFAIARPRILVCGLNPHAGEDGTLGREEIDIIEPTLQALREQGLWLRGPVSADTAFTSEHLTEVDAVLTMYHDQGLPVIKYASFGEVVNVTLGLPIIRTSVDHGTALDLAGTGRARVNSLRAALKVAHLMAQHSRQGNGGVHETR